MIRLFQIAVQQTIHNECLVRSFGGSWELTRGSIVGASYALKQITTSHELSRSYDGLEVVTIITSCREFFALCPP